jgi:hypothetical protein
VLIWIGTKWRTACEDGTETHPSIEGRFRKAQNQLIRTDSRGRKIVFGFYCFAMVFNNVRRNVSVISLNPKSFKEIQENIGREKDKETIN